MLLAPFDRQGNGPGVAKCHHVPESGSNQTHLAPASAFLGCPASFWCFSLWFLRLKAIHFKILSCARKFSRPTVNLIRSNVSPPPLPAKLTPLPPWWPRRLSLHPRASQPGEFCPRLTPPWGHGAVSGDILGVTPEGGDRLPAPRGQRPEKLLGILQRTGQHPHQPRAVCLKPCQSGETLKIELDFCAPNPFLLCVKGTVSHNLPRRQT